MPARRVRLARGVRARAAARRVSPFGLAAAAVLLSSLFEAWDVGGHWLLYEDVACVAAPLIAFLAVFGKARHGDAEHARIRYALALAMLLTALGQFLRAIPDAVPAASGMAPVLSDLLYVGGAVVGVHGLMRTLFERMPKEDRQVLLLDGLIIMLTAMTFVFSVWQAQGNLEAVSEAGSLRLSLSGLMIMAIVASFFASAAAAGLVALALRVPPRLDGVWSALAGIVLVALAWSGWLARFLAGGHDSIEVMDFVFPLGSLLLGYGGRTWSLTPAHSPRYDRYAQTATEWLPLVAVLGVGAADILVHRELTRLDPLSLMAWLVVFAAMIRQRVTRVRERSFSERLSREVQERAATSVSLARLEAAETPEATADRVCIEALRLEGMDTACVYAFDTEAVVPLAVHGLPGFPTPTGEAVPDNQAQRLRHHADFGLWIEQWAGRASDDPFELSLIAAGLSAEALVPLYWNDEPFGLIAMGSTSVDAADRVTARLAAITEFGVVAAAILGPMVAERRLASDLRREIRGIIESEAFHPVYQPFVQLGDGAIIGYEALTRFDDGRRPDLRFEDARAAGLAVELECACVRRQIAEAAGLPEGRWVSLNASPALAERPDLLLDLLAGTDRDVVLEITEHAEIADYPLLLAALDQVRHRARLAVDDAGAGYSGLRHILELRPQYVKLDMSIVRSVDTDPARQAMVAGMAHFAQNAGCELIAEGIETAGELETLKHFDVGIGQGFLLGRPARIA